MTLGPTIPPAKTPIRAAGRRVSDVTYSPIGRRISAMPGPEYWERAADALREVAAYGREFGLTIGIEPINRYETSLEA